MEFYKSFTSRRGFTLIEMMIAMSIFVTFLGILFNSYTSIIRAQQEANDYREMYVEARQVFDYLTQELRNGVVDYAAAGDVGVFGNQDSVTLVSKDAAYRVTFTYDGRDKVVRVYKETFSSAPIEEKELNHNVNITEMDFYVSPAIDPYNQKYFSFDKNQFHPQVTIFARFEKELSGAKEPLTMELQTTISSRVYNQVYAN